MASDVTLSAAVRSSLLSLQNTTSLIDRTQNRLSSGLRVASSIDDPVAFFQAKTLTDRAFDFGEKKNNIDQGISTVSAALQGIESIEAIVRQLKGITSSLKSATGSQFTDLVSQFNSVRTQIGNLADDATYQGVNLVNNTTETLTVSFSEKTGSLLTVNAVNVRESGLGIAAAIHGSGVSVSLFNFAANTTNLSLSAGETIAVTYLGTARTVDSATSLVFTYGTVSVNVVGNTATNINISAGDTITLTLSTSVGSAALATGAATGGGVAALSGTSFYGLITAAAAAGLSSATITINDVDANNTNYVTEGNSTQVDAIITKLDSALTSLRSNAQTLGSNVALLQTRLDFTQTYVTTLTTGSSKLTLADINEEGANLLALQTRQQLGISSLAFAGQAEQGILALFR
jgi:flagellin-like hook-associated protein FlgL